MRRLWTASNADLPTHSPSAAAKAPEPEAERPDVPHQDEAFDKLQDELPFLRCRVLPRAWQIIVGFCLIHVANFCATQLAHNWMPPPRPADASQELFAEQRARETLQQIMSFGFRIVGSEANEVQTPKFLLEKIHEIKAQASSDVMVEVDVQRPSGAFGLNFLDQFQNIYTNVTNILVRVTPQHAEAKTANAWNNSLLLSSHYDAAIGSAAGSDDGVNIAIMMELLRLYVLQPPRFGSIIFNFNGAEETILQAAHGFITQHPWKDTIRAFINLEAAGAGGREILFQSGSDEMALAYAKGAPYPYASIIAQEVFQSGIIQADTDYRIYRDFGYVTGIDLAYIANGYVYHTALDDMSRIQQGAIQRLGDNMVGVINQLINVEGKLAKVASASHASHTLFFDLGGIVMITLEKRISFALSGLLLLLATVYLSNSPVTMAERKKCVWFLLRSGFTAILVNLAVAGLLTLFAPMAWYSQPYLGALIYTLIALASMAYQFERFLIAQHVKSPLVKWKLEETIFEATLCIYMAGLAGLLACNIISSYVFAIWCFFPLMGQLTCQVLQRFGRLSSWTYISISLASIALPLMHTGLLMTLALQFFIPIMGRSGTLLPPDFVLAPAVGIFVVVLVSYSGRFFCFVPVQQLTNWRRYLCLVTLVVVVLSSLRNPYSDDCPKRLFVQHVYRTVSLPDEPTQMDTGLWVNALDFRGLSSIKPFVKPTEWPHEVLLPPKALVDNEIYGIMPWFLPLKDFVPERTSWYLPTTSPIESLAIEPARLEIVSSKYDADTDRRKIHLFLSGPSHLNMFIDAKTTKLTRWSIGNGIDGPAPASSDSYILQFATGTPPGSFHFWIEAESSQPVRAVVVGHHVNETSPELDRFVKDLPSWVLPVGLISTWQVVEL